MSEELQLVALAQIKQAVDVLQQLLPPADQKSPALSPLWQACEGLRLGLLSAGEVYAWVCRNLGNLVLQNSAHVPIPETRLVLGQSACELLRTSLKFQANPEVQAKLEAASAALTVSTSAAMSAKQWCSVGTHMHDAQQWSKSQQAFAKAVELDPNADDAFFMWLYMSWRCADWGNISFTEPLVARYMAQQSTGVGGKLEKQSCCRDENEDEGDDTDDDDDAPTLDSVQSNSSNVSPLAALLNLNSLGSTGVSVASPPSLEREGHGGAEKSSSDLDSWADLLHDLEARLQTHFFGSSTPQTARSGMLGHPWILENFPVARNLQLEAAKAFSKLMTGLAHREGVAQVSSERPSLAGDRRSSSLSIARRNWATSHADRPLRIGFVSADFRQKATLYLCVDPMVQMFKQAGHGAGPVDSVTGRKTELFVFATSPDFAAGSSWRVALKEAAGDEHFVELGHLANKNHAAMAREIRRRDIDVLIDMDGYSNEGVAVRTLFATRLAPVTTSWFVYMATTGQENIDFIIADKHVLPAHVALHHSEAVLELPSPFFPISHASLFPNTDELDSPVTKNRWRAKYGLPAIGAGQVLFASFNKHLKITPHVWASWMHILRKVPNSVLVLLENPADGVPNLQAQFEKAGFAPDRLKWCPFVSTSEEHIFRVAMVDVILDTPPWGAHTGAADALWCAVPLVTTPSPTWDAPLDGSMESMASRVATSLLNTAGAHDLVGKTIADYTAIAIRLGTDSAWRAGMVARLKAARSGPTFDSERYARNFLHGIHLMYQAAVDSSSGLDEKCTNLQADGAFESSELGKRVFVEPS